MYLPDHEVVGVFQGLHQEPVGLLAVVVDLELFQGLLTAPGGISLDEVVLYALGVQRHHVQPHLFGQIGGALRQERVALLAADIVVHGSMYVRITSGDVDRGRDKQHVQYAGDCDHYEIQRPYPDAPDRFLTLVLHRIIPPPSVLPQ